MPKFITPVPLVIFRQLKSPGFYPLGGVQGLYLRIRGASESYILRYQDTFGKRRSMSLGLRRSMSLSEARTKATEIRARLSEGINPTPTRATRRKAKTQQSSSKTAPTSKTFAEVMDLWLKYRVENNYWVNDRKEPYPSTISTIGATVPFMTACIAVSTGKKLPRATFLGWRARHCGVGKPSSGTAQHEADPQASPIMEICTLKCLNCATPSKLRN